MPAEEDYDESESSGSDNDKDHQMECDELRKTINDGFEQCDVLFHKQKSITKSQHQECNKRFANIERTLPEECRQDDKSFEGKGHCEMIREIGQDKCEAAMPQSEQVRRHKTFQKALKNCYSHVEELIDECQAKASGN